MDASNNWTNDIAETRPRYLAIADAIERAAQRGTLQPGDQLRPLRSLAKDLGLDIGTVSRAYEEIKKRGLAGGQVGRGTFVQKRKADAPPSLWKPALEGGFVDLSHNFPATTPDNPASSLFAAELNDLLSAPALIRQQADLGHLPHRQAMAGWMERCGMDVDAREVVITTGAQQGLLLAIQAVMQSDEVLLSESTTFYGALAAARFLGRRVVPVPMDLEGILPQALDRAFAVTGSKALYCNPTLHNPTTALMSLARREAIVSVCRKHDAIIVEDDVYGFLLTPRVRTLCSLAPERTVYVSSFSKIVGPGLRVGFVRAPSRLIERIGTGLRATTLMAPAPLTELICRLLKSDGMERMAAARSAQIRERQQWASGPLAGIVCQRHPDAFHVWLGIGAWRSEPFASAAMERGVAIAPGSLFQVDSEARSQPAARVCVSAAQDRETLTSALRVLTRIIAEGPTGGPSRRPNRTHAAVASNDPHGAS